MNWILIAYVTIGIIWMGLVTMGVYAAATQENKEITTTATAFIVLLLIGAIWPLSMPFLICADIGKKSMKRMK